MRRPAFVKLIELKNGDKFYGLDGIIYIFLDYEILPRPATSTVDQIRYRMKPWKIGDGIVSVACTYCGTYDIEVLRYTRRDRGSFLAGFKIAMNLCMKHMRNYDLENTGIETPVDQHMTMLKEYQKWKQNYQEIS
jgi:hypothetical protein